MSEILDAYIEWRENNGNEDNPTIRLSFLNEYDLYSEINKVNN